MVLGASTVTWGGVRLRVGMWFTDRDLGLGPWVLRASDMGVVTGDATGDDVEIPSAFELLPWLCVD